MSFTRTKYDTCAEKMHYTASMGVGDYSFYMPQQLQLCYPSHNQFIIQRAGILSDTNLESSLRNLDTQYTRCGSLPETLRGLPHFFNMIDCETEARLKKAVHPLAQLFLKSEVQLGTRNIMKDNHRPRLPSVRINSMDP